VPPHASAGDGGAERCSLLEDGGGTSRSAGQSRLYTSVCMTSTPLYIVEEHHEAFFVWGYAMLHGQLAPSGNALLHVDEHADLSVPAFHSPARERKTDLPSLAAFTYHHLGIASFILPAVYQGIFDEICWVHPRVAKGRATRLIISSFEGDAMNLQMIPAPAQAQEPGGDGRFFDYRLQAVTEPYTATRPVVLDIDIDFFSSDERSKSCRLEVTRDEYEKFHRDPYHMLRLMPNKAARASIEDGRYFLEVTSSHPEPVLLPPPTPAQIAERVEVFVAFLKMSAVQPQIIIVCRSRFSGFTPTDQWEFIEQTVLAGLRELYTFEPTHIREITPNDR
jgi:hypothetical protein